jgi:hypothetical protein
MLQLLALLALARWASAGLQACVLPPTRHLNFSDGCADHADIAAPNISWAAQRGEFESMQLLVSGHGTGGGALSVTFSDLAAPGGATLPKSLLSWRQQGYVFARHTSRYADSGCPNKTDCWRPDPLLPPSGDNTITLEAAANQPLWITVQVPRNATPAAQGSEYTGTVTITLEPAQDDATRRGGAGRDQAVRAGSTATIPIMLEVWPVAVPTTAEASVQHVWGFGVKNVLQFYPGRDNATVAKQWWDFMEAHRIPPLEAAFSSLAPAGWLRGKTGVLETGLHRTDCNCSSCPEWAAKDNAMRMKPTVEAAAQAAGTEAKFFAYGFDEAPKSCEKSIRTSFKAFFDAFPVSRYPQVAGTMAALNWAGAGGHGGPTGSHPSAGGMPMDMPYTGWVLQYQYYNATTAAQWVNSSYAGRPRQLYLYHCIEPSGVDFLNIFLERPLIQARLLFWLGSIQNIQGWLYWATDLWANCPTAPSAGGKNDWMHKNVTVMRRINGTMLTDFEPGSVIWCKQKLYEFWVNGDGYCECRCCLYFLVVGLPQQLLYRRLSGDIQLTDEGVLISPWHCVDRAFRFLPGARRPDQHLQVRKIKFTGLTQNSQVDPAV